MSIAALQEKLREKKTPLALELSPEVGQISPKILKNFTDMYGSGPMAEAEALRYHGSQLISQTAPLLPAVLLRADCYLRYGFMGMDVLSNLVNMARQQGMYTIVDARTAWPEIFTAGGVNADGVTVSPYMGSDSCQAAADKSAFAAVRTANSSADQLQNLPAGDRRLYVAAAQQLSRRGAALMAELSYEPDVKELRRCAPDAFLLLPGCDGESALPAFDDYGHGAMLTDRSLQCAQDPVSAAEEARARLKRLIPVL